MTPEKYFIQVARFDPAKGIPDGLQTILTWTSKAYVPTVIKSYAEFRRQLKKLHGDSDAPELLM